MLPFILRAAGYWVGMVVTDYLIGKWEDARMNRELKRYRNENGGEVTAHKVTEETAGTVMTPGGVPQEANEGDVLVGTDRPDVFYVMPGDTLDGYGEVDAAAETPEDAQPVDVERDQDDQSSEEYDPSQHTVLEVRQYLRAQAEAGNDAEVRRVLDAEMTGKNRSSVWTHPEW